MPAALLSVVAGSFLLLALLAILVVLVVANRADPDVTGRRPLAVYFFGVSFLALFATLFGSFAVVLGLVQLIGHHTGFSESPALHPVGDAVARVAIVSGIITLVALAVLVVHIRRALEVSGRADPRTGPLGRVAQSYVATVSFVAVLVTSAASVFVLYQLVRIIAPGVFQVTGTRVESLRPLLAAAYLALAALAILVLHMRLVPPDVRRGSFAGRHSLTPAHDQGSAMTAAPTYPPSGPFPPAGPVPPSGPPPGAAF